MMFIYLSLALFSGMIALHSFAKLVAVTFGDKRWIGRYGALLNCIIIAAFGTLSLWMLTLAYPGIRS